MSLRCIWLARNVFWQRGKARTWPPSHGAGVEGMEGSNSDEDGAMDAGFETEDMFFW